MTGGGSPSVAPARRVYALDTSTAGALPRLVVSASDGRWHVLGWSIHDRALLLGRERNVASADTAHGDGAPRAADVDRSVSPLVTACGRLGTVGALGAALGRELAARASIWRTRGMGAFPRAASGARRTSRHSARASNPTPAAIASARARERWALDPVANATGLPEPRRQRRHEFAHLCFPPIRGRRLAAAVGSEPHDVELFGQSADGSVRSPTLSMTKARADLVLYRSAAAVRVSRGTAGPWCHHRAEVSTRHGQRLAMTFESARSAPDAYVLEARTGAVTRWTRSDAGGARQCGVRAAAAGAFPDLGRDRWAAAAVICVAVRSEWERIFAAGRGRWWCGGAVGRA